MNTAQAEHYAFGPWILEVTDKKFLPPLFVPYYKGSNSFLILIKIPRNIDRRNAVPGMDLYDYVIGMYDDHIYLLERKEKAIEEINFSYDEIEGLENFIDLLLGRLTIFLKDRKIVISYNAVSKNIITELVKIIRSKYAIKSYENVRSSYNQNEDMDILYLSLLTSMKSSGDIINISAVQSSINVRTVNQSFFQKLLHSIFQKKLLPSLHLSNDKELLVLSRGKTFKYRDAVYSYALTYIPIEKIQGIELIKDNNYDNLQRLEIKINDCTLIFYLDVHNKNAQNYYEHLRSIL